MVKLFVEGGGDSRAINVKCRKGFSDFLEKSGLKGKMPRVVASGTRQNAKRDYITDIESGKDAMLLVDSEEAVAPIEADEKYAPENWEPWKHLKSRDGWDKPAKADSRDCHLMVQVMETWFIADIDGLKKFYKDWFSEKSLPQNNEIESIPKDTVIKCLKVATKGKYKKGEHSYELLSQIDPSIVAERSPWAKRFIKLLAAKMLIKMR